MSTPPTCDNRCPVTTGLSRECGKRWEEAERIEAEKLHSPSLSIWHHRLSRWLAKLQHSTSNPPELSSHFDARSLRVLLMMNHRLTSSDIDLLKNVGSPPLCSSLSLVGAMLACCWMSSLDHITIFIVDMTGQLSPQCSVLTTFVVPDRLSGSPKVRTLGGNHLRYCIIIRPTSSAAVARAKSLLCINVKRLA